MTHASRLATLETAIVAVSSAVFAHKCWGKECGEAKAYVQDEKGRRSVKVVSSHGGMAYTSTVDVGKDGKLNPKNIHDVHKDTYEKLAQEAIAKKDSEKPVEKTKSDPAEPKAYVNEERGRKSVKIVSTHNGIAYTSTVNVGHDGKISPKNVHPVHEKVYEKLSQDVLAKGKK